MSGTGAASSNGNNGSGPAAATTAAPVNNGNGNINAAAKGNPTTPTTTTTTTSSSAATTTAPGNSALNVKDALSYLDQVKLSFSSEPDIYNRFLDIMKDFKQHVIDTPGVIDRVSSLFRSQPQLISGFNTFLPDGYRLVAPLDPKDTTITVITPQGVQRFPSGFSNNLRPRAPADPSRATPGTTARGSWQRSSTTPAAPTKVAAATPKAQTAEVASKDRPTPATPAQSTPATAASTAVNTKPVTNAPAASTPAAVTTPSVPAPVQAAPQPAVKREVAPAAAAKPSAAGTYISLKDAVRNPQAKLSTEVTSASPQPAAATTTPAPPAAVSSVAASAPAPAPSSVTTPAPAPASTTVPASASTDAVTKATGTPAPTPAVAPSTAPAAKATAAPAASAASATAIAPTVPAPLPATLAAPPATAQASRTATPGAAATLSENRSGGTRTPIEFNHAISYVNKIKSRFIREPDVYKNFLDILQTYQKEHKPISEVYVQVTKLFKAAPDLLDEFKQFLPDHSQQSDTAKTASASRAKAKPAAVAPAVVEDAAASLKRKRAGYSNVPGQTSVAAAPPPPVYATPAVPAASGPTTAPVVRQKTGKRGMTKSVLAGVRDPPTVAQQSNMRYDAGPNGTSGAGTTSVYPQPILSYLPAGYTLPGNGSMDMVNQTDPPVAGESLEERHFFDRVTEWIDDKFTYYEFLKLLNLYTQDLIDLPTLVSRAWLFIGNAPDLWADFREIVGWRDGAVIAGRTIENGEWIIENIPAIDRKTTDLTKMPAAGPSYRRLPAHDINRNCSGRDNLCWEVLNDEWVSVMSLGSEEVFIAHRKNPFEEALHRTEEERHEYDFHIEANIRTIALLEPIASRIMSMEPEERQNFRLKNGLGGQSKSIYQRVIKKVYGKDVGREVIHALHENPCITVPIVLTRLKQKDEEWKQSLREWNRVWREVDAKNFYRSLDHQGITFKAQDKRYLASKSLVNEIENLRRIEMQRQISAPPAMRPPPATYQLAYQIQDENILFDSLKLLLSYLDRAPGYHTMAERDRIEAFLRSLTSLVFAVPVSVLDTMLKPLPADDDTSMSGDDPGNQSDSPSTLSNGLRHRMTNGSDETAAKKKADLRQKVMRHALGDGRPSDAAVDGLPSDPTVEVTTNGQDSSLPQDALNGNSSMIIDTKPALDASIDSNLPIEEAHNGDSTFKTDVPATAAGLDSMQGVETINVPSSTAQSLESSALNVGPAPLDLRSQSEQEPPKTDGQAEGVSSVPPTPNSSGESSSSHSSSPHSRHHQIRRFNFFCNTPYYIAIRLLQLLYSRLETMKEASRALALAATKDQLGNSTFTQYGKATTNKNAENKTTTLYDNMMELCESLFGSEIDQGTFEDGIRGLFGNKAYLMFTIDKLLSALVKTVWSLIDANREAYVSNGEVFKLLVDDRRYPTTVQAQQVSYRRNAEMAAGSDENLYRVEWQPQRHLLTFQLLGKDEVLPEDEIDLSKAWEKYIESFLSDEITQDLALSGDIIAKTVYTGRNLRAVKSSPLPELQIRSELESRICMRSYRIFWQKSTEDVMIRARAAPSVFEQDQTAKLRTRRKTRWEKWAMAQSEQNQKEQVPSQRNKPVSDADGKKGPITADDNTSAISPLNATPAQAMQTDDREPKARVDESSSNMPALPLVPAETEQAGSDSAATKNTTQEDTTIEMSATAEAEPTPGPAAELQTSTGDTIMTE